MLKLSEKMREQRTQYEIVSKRDGKFLYFTTAIVNAASFVAIAVSVTSICLVSLETLALFQERLRPLLDYVAAATSAIRNNAAYLNLVRPGLGDRYLLSFVVCLVITAVAVPLHFVLAVVALFSRNLSPHPFNGKHAKAILSHILLFCFAAFIVFFFDFSSRGGPEPRLQKLFGTEWAIFTMAFFSLGLSCMIYALFFTIIKLIRFGGKIKHDWQKC